MGVLDHPKMNTSAQEHRAPQQHMHHGVEGNTKPHTGPKAFAAMKQDEARKQSTTCRANVGIFSSGNQLYEIQVESSAGSKTIE